MIAAANTPAGAVTEDRSRDATDWLWDTKAASEAVGCHPRKFGDWWTRTRGKLLALAELAPGQTAAELMAIVAAGASRSE